MLTRRNFLKSTTYGATGFGLLSAIGLSGLSIVTLPQNALAAKPEVFTGIKDGYGAGGYDVVAYFTQKKPIEGDDKFETTWNGAKWAFSSQKNLDKFTAAPEKYAPQFGGYCAYAASKGATAKGDPLAWTVHNDKLYLNYSKQVRTKWRHDIDANIAAANKNWPNILK